jgi:hypothetical protein
MAIIKSGASTDNLTIGVTNKAAYTEKRDARGNATSMKRSYAACTAVKFAAAAGTTVFAQIFGSASTTIRVHRIIVGGSIATAAINADLIINKRSAVGSGGTATTLTQVPKDSGSAAGTATVVKVFTAAPTAGTGGGVIATQTMFMGITPAIGQNTIFDWSMESMNEAPVLRGTVEGLELSFGTTAGNIATLCVSFEWTEE